MAGACALVIASTILPWFLSISVLGALLSLPALIRRHRREPVAERSAHRSSRVPSIATMTALVLTLVVCLVPLRVPSVGWDARAIWLLRSSWFLQGHGYLLYAMRDATQSGLIAHASYPPLVSTAVAVSWQLTGNHSERLGVVVITLLNAAATLATAWVIVEIGRIGGRNEEPGKRARLAELIGAVCAVLFVLVAFDVFGPFATNGYADPLWSMAAAGAIGYGLILPCNRRNVGAAAILLAVSGLTKTEGTATAILLVILISTRYALDVVRPRLKEASGLVPRQRFKAAGRALARDCVRYSRHRVSCSLASARQSAPYRARCQYKRCASRHLGLSLARHGHRHGPLLAPSPSRSSCRSRLWLRPLKASPCIEARKRPLGLARPSRRDVRRHSGVCDRTRRHFLLAAHVGTPNHNVSRHCGLADPCGMDRSRSGVVGRAQEADKLALGLNPPG